MQQEDDELRALMMEQEGRIANEAADACLKLLGALGANRREATVLYRSEVCGLLVRVFLAMAAVRQCVEAAMGNLSHQERLCVLTRMVGMTFAIDPEPVIEELLLEARSAFRS